MDGDGKMKRELQFVNSMIKKLKTQGDISKEEATRMFVLATVIYSYEMGWYGEGNYRENFNHRGFTVSSPIEHALGNWYKEVFSRMNGEYHNFLASIPSRIICPETVHFRYYENFSPPVIKVIGETLCTGNFFLRKKLETSDSVYANGPMVEWLKSNVPLSFDVICCHKRMYDFEVEFARFGALGLLPIYKREIDEDGLRKLSDLDIPILRNENAHRKDLFHKCYQVACLPEHRDILDAVADGLPVPERRPVEKRPHKPRDLFYIDALTSRISCGRDISTEESDDLYLLFKTYQAIRMAALKAKGPVRQEIKDSVEPGLKTLRSWYKAVEKELKKNRKGNFVYTLPTDTSMNLYCLRDYVERCLKILPKEPSKVVVRCNDRLPVKDDCLDARSLTTTGASDRYVYYFSGRYGFFDRNGIDMNEWHPVAEYKDGVSRDVFDDFRGKPILGKLRFAESLGIKYIVMNDTTIAVKEKDLDKVREILDLSDDRIMQTAYFLARKDLEEIESMMEKLKKKPENREALDLLIRKERKLKTLKEDDIPLEYVTKGVETIYRKQKEKEKYLEEDDWMEMDR